MRTARSLRPLAARSKSLLRFQMSPPQLRHFAKDLLQPCFAFGNAASCFAGCQVDDLKKAPRLKGFKPNFAHAVLRAVCRRVRTKMEGLSDFNSERCLRPSSRRTQILHPAMPIKLIYTTKRRALHVKGAPICSIPHTSPLVASKLDFAGRPLGERC